MPLIARTLLRDPPSHLTKEIMLEIMLEGKQEKYEVNYGQVSQTTNQKNGGETGSPSADSLDWKPLWIRSYSFPPRLSRVRYYM